MASSSEVLLKSNYEVSSKIEALYTGGKVQFSSDEQYVFCLCTEKVQIVDVDSGKICHSLQEDGDVISSFAASPDDQFVVTASKNLLLRQWEWKNEKQIKTWKAIHVAPISCMVFDSTSTLLATGSSDSTIKVWDIIKQYYTHNLRGSQGVVSLVCFHPDPSILQLFSAADDCKIRIWDLKKSRCVGVLESHFSVVTSLAFDSSLKNMISSSRDNVLNIWDLESIHLPDRKAPRTIPCFEGVEAVVMLDKNYLIPGCESNGEMFVTAGSKGVLRFWSLKDAKCVHTLSVTEKDIDTESTPQQIIHASLCRTRSVLSVVTYDHNIILYDLNTLAVNKQLVGYNDDILDMCFAGSHGNHLAVATNSNQLRLYSMDTMDCRMLSGHSNIVLAVDVSPDGEKIVTGSKDNNVRLWNMDSDSHFDCTAVGKGHTHAVSTVAWSRTGDHFVASGSQDLTFKIWTIPLPNKDEPGYSNMVVKITEKAHDKDVNSVAVSPNDKLLATGSQDKSAKVWRIKDGALMGALRGHKRGVWCVQFSPVDQCIATASGDSTIKIWALSDMTCIKTFEGHSSSVLQVLFISRGMQLLSSGSDGLVKLWTIRTNECVKTFDQHTDKVWSIATNKTQEILVSGGGDSVINVWKDITKEEQQQAHEETEKKIVMEQQLSNLLYNKKYTEAIGVAITLEQPYRLLKIFNDMLNLEEGWSELNSTIKELRDDQIDSVLKFIVGWNTNAKNTFTTQTVLSLIFKNKSPYDLLERPDMKETIESLLPYAERHLKRINRLLQQSEFLEYTWQRMKLTAPKEPVRTLALASDDSATTTATISHDHTQTKEATMDPPVLQATQNGHAHKESSKDEENNIDEDDNDGEKEERENVVPMESPSDCKELKDSKTLKNKETIRLKRKLKTPDEAEMAPSKPTKKKEGKENATKTKLKGKKKLRTAS